MRGHCPGCGRDDVPLLPPRAARPGHEAQPWRRKDHAISGSLAAVGTTRCRYQKYLTPDEIDQLPLEEPCN